MFSIFKSKEKVFCEDCKFAEPATLTFDGRAIPMPEQNAWRYATCANDKMHTHTRLDYVSRKHVYTKQYCDAINNGGDCRGFESK